MFAFSIMFFCGALLSFMLGWADGVRHDKTVFHIPEIRSFLVVTAIFAGCGLILLAWGMATKRT